MIVLDGETSQWKRSEGSRRAIGPALGIARRDPGQRLRCASTAAGVGVRGQRAQARLVERDPRRQEAPRAAVQHDAGVEALPALHARHDPQDRVLERATRRLGHARPPPRRLAAARAAGAGSRRARGAARRVALEPQLRHLRRDRLQPPGVEAPRQPLVGVRDRAGAGQQHVIADRGERAPAPARRGRRRRGGRTAPRRGRSATARPCQSSRFGLRGVRSTFVTSASNHTTSAASSGDGAAPPAGRTRSAPGRKSMPRLRPAAPAQEVLDLGVGLRAAELGVELHEHQLRDGQAERARPISPAITSATSAFDALAGAAELEHVEAVVVGLHEPGHRAALAQRRDVAGSRDRAHGPRPYPPGRCARGSASRTVGAWPTSGPNAR